MIDTDLIVEALRRRGHAVGSVIPVPENAGEWEFVVDGEALNLEETRALIEADDARGERQSPEVITEDRPNEV
jgi:hypothetical protein